MNGAFSERWIGVELVSPSCPRNRRPSSQPVLRSAWLVLRDPSPPNSGVGCVDLLQAGASHLLVES